MIVDFDLVRTLVLLNAQAKVSISNVMLHLYKGNICLTELDRVHLLLKLLVSEKYTKAALNVIGERQIFT